MDMFLKEVLLLEMLLLFGEEPTKMTPRSRQRQRKRFLFPICEQFLSFRINNLRNCVRDGLGYNNRISLANYRLIWDWILN
jgi:hypothetical protein